MGVPQGSVLGPPLFSLYVNDLLSMCDDVGIQMYADDTVIYMDGRNPEQVAAKVSVAMVKIVSWLHEFSLTLNEEKT